MESITYKKLVSIEPTDSSGYFMVTMELSDSPDDQWKEELLSTAARSPYCPRLEFGEKAELIFASSKARIRQHLEIVQKMIGRANYHLTIVRPVNVGQDPNNKETAIAKNLEEQLRKEGY